MVMPCFMSERRAQSVRVALFNESRFGVSAARAFCPACQSRGTLFQRAGHGRPRQFVLQASPARESLARRRTASLAASRIRWGRECPRLAPGLLRGRAAGRDSRARHWLKPPPTKLAEKRTYHVACEAAPALRTALLAVSSTAAGAGTFPSCGFELPQLESASIWTPFRRARRQCKHRWLVHLDKCIDCSIFCQLLQRCSLSMALVSKPSAAPHRSMWAALLDKKAAGLRNVCRRFQRHRVRPAVAALRPKAEGAGRRVAAFDPERRRGGFGEIRGAARSGRRLRGLLRSYRSRGPRSAAAAGCRTRTRSSIMRHRTPTASSSACSSVSELGPLPAVIGGYIGNPWKAQPWIECMMAQGSAKGRWPGTGWWWRRGGRGYAFDELPVVGEWPAAARAGDAAPAKHDRRVVAELGRVEAADDQRRAHAARRPGHRRRRRAARQRGRTRASAPCAPPRRPTRLTEH